MEMRKVYAETIKEIALKDENVYVLEADLSTAMATIGLKDILQDRYINVGIMEAQMMGVAAGISVAGGTCFVHTFGQFATRRAFDQVFVSLAYAKQNVIIVGSDSGVTAEHNGGTHMSFEDTGLMRLVPKAKVYDVSDSTEFKAILLKAYEEGGVHYIRTMRKATPDIYSQEEEFTTGAKLVREGKDVSLIANGICVVEALEAARLLAKEGIEAEVIDCYQIKPLDKSLLLQTAKKTGLVVTCENHNIIGALGSAVCEYLSEVHPTRVIRIGVDEQFGQVGSQAYLKEFYGMTGTQIADRVKEQLIK